MNGYGSSHLEVVSSDGLFDMINVTEIGHSSIVKCIGSSKSHLCKIDTHGEIWWRHFSGGGGMGAGCRSYMEIEKITKGL